MDLTESVMAMKAGDGGGGGKCEGRGTVWADGCEFDNFWQNPHPQTSISSHDETNMKKKTPGYQELDEEFGDENVTPFSSPKDVEMTTADDLEEIKKVAEEELEMFQKMSSHQIANGAKGGGGDNDDDEDDLKNIDQSDLLRCDEELKDLEEGEELKSMDSSPQQASLKELVVEIIKKEDEEITRLQLLGKICDPSSSSSGAPSPSSLRESPCPSSPLTTELEKALRRMLIQRHICLLLHAQQCEKQRDSQCLVSNCQIVKMLLAHLRACRNGVTCSTPHCFPSRQIMFHWNKCQSGDCPICSPLRLSLGSPSPSPSSMTTTMSCSRSQTKTVSPDSGTDGHSPEPVHDALTPKMDTESSPQAPVSASKEVTSMGDTPGTRRYNLREPRSKPRFHHQCGECGHLTMEGRRMKSRKRKIEWTTPTRSNDEGYHDTGTGSEIESGSKDHGSVDKPLAPSSSPMDKNIEPVATNKSVAKMVNDSWDESGDPENKTWCICHQPENNRRMICCDRCSFWFHSSCVRVNKVKAIKMSKRHVPWLCPLCQSSDQSVCDSSISMDSMDQKKEGDLNEVSSSS